MSEATYPVIKITGCKMAENTYKEGDKVWTVANLIERAKELTPFDLPLAAVDAGSRIWTPIESAYDLAGHMRRVLDVGTDYPVILSQQGFIMDGWHRITRALIDGKATIKAVRFEENPPYDYVEPKA